jgi:hypothetical protein
MKLTARKLKVTIPLDPSQFAGPPIADTAPSRTVLSITIDGTALTADIATKSLRKAVKTVADNGADKVAVILQGSLVDNRIEEAGLVVQLKTAKEAAA